LEKRLRDEVRLSAHGVAAKGLARIFRLGLEL